MDRHLHCDTVIVGAGVAGLYTALHLPADQRILLICKEDLDSCDSMLAQGGICVQHDDADYAPFFEDTLRAGHYENRRESVDRMIRESRAVIDHLCALGVPFDRHADGSLCYTKEGAHSRPRICFHKDRTGVAITRTLQQHVLEIMTSFSKACEQGKYIELETKYTRNAPMQHNPMHGILED